MSFLNNYLRVKRAKKQGRLQEEYKQLNNKPFCSEQDKLRKQVISGEINGLKEKNKIASENNKKPYIDNSKRTNNFTYQKQNGINNPKIKLEYSKPKKQK